MKKNLFGNIVELKSTYCSLNGEEPEKIAEPYVNLYIQLKGCNAKCKFCEFQDVANVFNFDKLKVIIEELKRCKLLVNKISITGGEPTINLDTLYKIIKTSKSEFPDSFLVVNTNGYKLIELYKSGISRELDSISLSRHHYKDEINDEIFGFKTIRGKDIESIQHCWRQQKNKLHLSCNLIGGYIDSADEVCKYLEFANDVKIYDVGLVSLMKINYFCKDNFIDFLNLEFKNKKIFLSKEWSFMNSCKCKNYLYIPERINEEVVKVYHRCFIQRTEVLNSLVYDGENLKLGFNGLTLI